MGRQVRLRVGILTTLWRLAQVLAVLAVLVVLYGYGIYLAWTFTR